MVQECTVDKQGHHQTADQEQEVRPHHRPDPCIHSKVSVHKVTGNRPGPSCQSRYRIQNSSSRSSKKKEKDPNPNRCPYWFHELPAYRSHHRGQQQVQVFGAWFDLSDATRLCPMEQDESEEGEEGQEEGEEEGEEEGRLQEEMRPRKSKTIAESESDSD